MRRACGLLLLWLTGMSVSAVAQTPVGVSFTISPDHQVVDANGASRLAGYKIYLVVGTNIVRVLDIGKPTPDASGSVSYPNTALFQGLPPNSYQLYLKAYGPGGESVSSNTDTFVVQGEPPPPPPPPVAGRDDFTNTTLDPAWTFVNPLGDATAVLTANPGHLTISVPAGRRHDCWSDAQSCVRVVRSLSSGDVVVDTQIDGLPIGTRFQTYGLFFWQNAAHFIRFEFWADGTGVYAASWQVRNGAGSEAFPRAKVTLGPSTRIRVTRTGSTYRMEASVDGSLWTTVGSLSMAGFVPVAVGVHVSNDGTLPATTAHVDYISVQPTEPPPPPPPPPPALTLTTAESLSVVSPDGNAVTVTYAAPVASGGTAPVTATCTPASGASYPVGTTTVACLATDSADQKVEQSFTVTVTYTPPPPPPPPPANTFVMTAVVKDCHFTATDTPPDNGGGWTVRFQRKTSSGWTSFGSSDSSFPYTRGPYELPAGPYEFLATWTKSGVSTVTRTFTLSCPEQ